jgi:hypothetical protein
VPHVEIDETTDQYLDFAAKIAGMTKGQVIAQLVGVNPSTEMPTLTGESGAVPIHADYDGHRTVARFFPGPGRIEIVEGPLAGRTFRTPSEAARAVVNHYKPNVSPHRNGWAFWFVTAGGAPLQSIRHRGH